MTATQPRRPASDRQSIVFPLRGPGGEPIDLWRTLISHGMAELPPMRTNEQDRSMTVTVPVRGGRPRIVRVLARDEVGVVEIIGPRIEQEGYESAVRRSIGNVAGILDELAA